jgi:hypothetical protein
MQEGQFSVKRQADSTLAFRRPDGMTIRQTVQQADHEYAAKQVPPLTISIPGQRLAIRWIIR